MTTTVEAVERYLETDLVLHEALARGYLNIRRAARWLIETQGWDTTEEAVVSALRRYDPDPVSDLEAVLALLEQADVSGRTGLALLEIPRTQARLEQLSQLLEGLDSKEAYGLFPERKRITVLLEEAHLDAARQALGDEAIQATGMVRLDLGFPREEAAVSSAIAVALNVLGHRGVHVEALFASSPGCSFLVSDQQAAIARRLLNDLARGEDPLLAA